MFTRSRPYPKKDNCYVERKTGRWFANRWATLGMKPPGASASERACRVLRLYVIIPQPQMKLGVQWVQARLSLGCGGRIADPAAPPVPFSTRARPRGRS